MTTEEERAATREALAATLRRQAGSVGTGPITYGSEEPKIKVISTGFPELNDALGIGGYPCGRIVDLHGPVSSGKSLLLLHALREAQHDDGQVALIDADRAFDAGFAQTHGVDLSRLLISRPENAEQALQLMDLLAFSGKFRMIAIDSAAALATKPEMESTGIYGETGMPSVMSTMVRTLIHTAYFTDTVLFFVNQVRYANNVLFGSREATTGGNALKSYASIRLDIRRIAEVRNEGELVGQRVQVKIVKTKLAEPWKKAEIDLIWKPKVQAVAKTPTRVPRGHRHEAT